MAHKNTGSALISALFMMTLIAIAVTAMSVRLQQDIQRTQFSITTDKLYLASQAVTFWAMQLLSEKTVPTDPKLFEFPKTRAHDVPGIITTGKIIDLQARFNINLLKDTPNDKKNQQYKSAFYLLLNHLLTKTPPETHRLIMEAVKHWVNDDVKGKGLDELTRYYAQQHPPYAPSHQLMRSISEFRLVKGVDDETYQTLLPYLIALPIPTTININTAPAPILMTLGHGIEEKEAEAIVSMRGMFGFKNMDQVNELLKKHEISVDEISLESNYFLAIATTKTQNSELELVHYTILKREEAKNKQMTVRIIQDSLNDY